MNILVINGPNLNMLGIREPEIYGNETYEMLVAYINKNKQNDNIEIYQSNHEGEIIDKIQKAYFDKIDGIIINPGAYTHYSYAILDAIKAVNIPVVEVHLSNINEREAFRKISLLDGVTIGKFAGKHFVSYKEALEFLRSYYGKSKTI